MPFAYYGAKHGLARKYPRPRYPLIVEPFAGAAGYSCHWAHLGLDVTLNDADALVMDTWRRVQTITLADLDVIDDELAALGPTGLTARYGDKSPVGAHTSEVLLGSIQGQWGPGPFAVTHRTRVDWRFVRARIEQVRHHVREWTLINGDYRDLPDVEATWFIDPPYQPIRSHAGNGYVHGSDRINYDELAEWCRSRRGQVIVCEQSPAAWLPFTPIATQPPGTANGGGATRTEVVWLSDQQQGSLFDL